MDPQTKEILERVKSELQKERKRASDPGQLTREPIGRPLRVNLWELSQRELDQEMANRLSSLNEDINTRPLGKVTSHRRLIGPAIVFGKRILRRLFKPYTNLILDRQVRFNEALVAFHLATFIRFRHLDEKLSTLEERIANIEDTLERLLDEKGQVPHRSGIT